MLVVEKRVPPALFRPDGWPRIAVAAVNVILVIALARSLAGLTLAILIGHSPPSANAPLLAGPAPGSDNPANPRPADYAAIGAWHLFGQVETGQPAPASPAPAPATSLNLRLVGIFFMERGGDRALALIAEGNGLERGYRIGESLPGGARLQRIQRDHVIVSRSGREEALNLPKLGETAPKGPPPAMPPTLPPDALPDLPTEPPLDMPPDAPPDEPQEIPEPPPEPAASRTSPMIDASALAQRVRGAMMTRPRALEDIAFASPYIQNNQFIGFRLRQGRDQKLFRQLGLNSGDVVTEINGNRLNNPVQSLSLLQEVLNADQVSVRVLRHGAEIPLNFSLSGPSPK